MAQNDRDKYLASLEQGSFGKEERLSIAKGTTFEGTATPPKVLARLCLDPDLVVRVEAKKSILRLDERSLIEIASDRSTGSDVLLFLAKHFHDSPAVGTAIIGNRNTTEKVLFYLQGEIDDSVEDIDRGSADSGIGQEVEFEIDEIVGADDRAGAGDDVQVSIEIDDAKDKKGGFLERERYADDDMEVVIGVQEGGEEVIEDHMLRRSIVGGGSPEGGEPGSAGDIDIGIGGAPVGAEVTGEGPSRDFTSALDAIEGKMDDVFTADAGPEGSRDSFITELGEEIEMASRAAPPGGAAGGATGAGRAPFPTRPDASVGIGRSGAPAKVVMNETRKEVAVSTGKFVARLPMGRYFYKVSPIEVLTKLVKIAFPIIAVLIILMVTWLALPRVSPPIEDMESSVNRIFYSVKKDGLNPKLPNPLPAGFSVAAWEFVDASAESEAGTGKLGAALEEFGNTFSEEIAYDQAKKNLDEMERTLKSNQGRISEINETAAVLNADKAKYLDLSSKNLLDEVTIEREYQKEVESFKADFSRLEGEVRRLEQDIADARRRIARYESIYGAGGNDPGYIANRMELDDLTKAYANEKPLYDRRKANYDNRLKEIRKQYQDMIDNTVWLETVEGHLGELGQEKSRLVSENRILDKEIKNAKEKLKVLAAERAKRPSLTGDNLIMFLLLSHYINEKEVEDVNSISFLKRYRIYKTVCHVDLTLAGNGKEEKKRYNVTFMRLQTEKSIIGFAWNKDSTTWVMTSMAAAK
jgi:hypothetical protein